MTAFRLEVKHTHGFRLFECTGAFTIFLILICIPTNEFRNTFECNVHRCADPVSGAPNLEQGEAAIIVIASLLPHPSLVTFSPIAQPSWKSA